MRQFKNTTHEQPPMQDAGIHEKPWGYEEHFTRNEPSTVKILTVNNGECESLQYHYHRSEFWYVLSGHGVFQVGEEEYEGSPGDEFYIPKTAKHRIIGASAEPLKVLEISFGEADDADIVRLEDKYGR